MESTLMSKTKKAIEESAHDYNVTHALGAILAAYEAEDSGSVIGNCKTIIESICITIHENNDQNVAQDITVPKLAKNTVKLLSASLKRKDQEAFIALVSSFTSSFESATNSIAHLRNNYCPVSHGRASSHQPLHMLYAEFIISQTDTLLFFLLNLIAHSDDLLPKEKLKQDKEFDEFLCDEFGSLEVCEDEYLASEILFYVNPEKYGEVLKDYRKPNEEIHNDE